MIMANLLISPLILLILMAVTRGDNCGEFITDSTINNLKFSGPSETYFNLTVKECTRQCMELAAVDNRACLSYGYQTYTKECYIYDIYAGLGDNSEPSEGLVFFWTYSNPCPVTYSYAADGHFCAKSYNTTETNWWNARDICRQDGGHLMILNKESKKDFVEASYNIYKDEHYIWIGATDEHDEGDWRWLDGSPITKFWQPEEPNGERRENCLELRHNPPNPFPFYGTLNDEACTRNNNFVCEIPQKIIL